MPTLAEPRLFILLEAICLDLKQTTVPSNFNLNRIGLPKAWRADDNFGLVLESDFDHLVELSSNFMSATLSLDYGLEVVKIQSK